MKKHQSLARQLMWMVAIWVASVSALGLVAQLIRIILKT
ncbi:hypothetical protein N182_37575 [Sinorhizobium sp. GL2]|nr:hypothetical protein N182_37575 [Sinorhizobium sp. GL2]